MTAATTIERIRWHAERILALLPPPDAAPPIATPAELDAALAAASPGATLTLATSLVYPSRLILSQSVTLQSATFQTRAGQRMTRDEPAPTFLAGLEVFVDDAALLGLALHGTETIGVLGGQHGVWDRCRLLGDPVHGAHRGIEFDGGEGAILRCYVDDVFRHDQDTQAIGAWDCDPGLLIEDCFLSAAGQSIMFGGSDARSEARIPTAINIHACNLTKNPAWVGTQQVKCALEFKAARDVLVEDCALSYGGTSQGQGCYLIVATVRNQDGAAPWSCIQHVEITHCTGSHASGVCNFLGTDNVYPSGRLDGFDLHDCTFENLDGWLGQGRLFLFGGSPAHVTLEQLTITGQHVGALGYFYGLPSPTGFVAGGLTLPSSDYGWYCDGDTGHGGSGRDHLLAYMPDAQLDNTIV
jgi:hypothetical protein